MATATALRFQIESALASRIPSALTPAPRMVRPVVSVGIASVDQLLHGGLPLGAITEAAGPECSGRTSFALSFLSHMTSSGKICAWIDVSDSLHPESAAAASVDLTRLLWVRCGVSTQMDAKANSAMSFEVAKDIVAAPAKERVHGSGCGRHPRDEVKGLSVAVGNFLKPERQGAQGEQLAAIDSKREIVQAVASRFHPSAQTKRVAPTPWSRIEQALRVTDLLLQGGGFSAIVLDFGGVAPEHAARVPLATWFRYRAAAERTQASILLLTQHPCAKSSAGLVLRMQPCKPPGEAGTVFTGLEQEVVVARERFAPAPSNVISLRKPPRSDGSAQWQSRAAWAGRR